MTADHYEAMALFIALVAFPMAVLFVALWLTRAKRNRRTGMGRPFTDSRNWSNTYMDSLNSKTRY